MIYIICGTPGSGKTTISNKLVQEKNALVLSLDYQTDKLYGQFDGCEWGIRERATKYQLMMDIFRHVENQTPVVLDYGFFKQHERDWYRELAKKLGTESEVIYVKTEYETQLQRVLGRNKKEDNIHEIDKELLDKLILEFEEPTDEDVVVIHN